jgi:antitoxin component of MazEF toxin-antitoxin module
MKLGRIVKLGNSWGVVMPVTIRRELRWFPGDDIDFHIHEDVLMLRNATHHDIEPITIKRQDFDKRFRRTQRSV